ncbi:MAG: hypothetical protein R3C14_35275 [Caldilineaceae bacterium]
MESDLLGIRLTFWAIPCLMMTVLWLYLWPRDRMPAQVNLRYLILRWFHALTWLLLTLATLTAGLGILGGATTGKVLGLLGLAAYLLFLYTTITSKPNVPAKVGETHAPADLSSSH